MKKRQMPDNIIRHSLVVRDASVMVAYALRRSGIRIDIRLVDRASLLHDICKIDSIQHGGDHALMGKLLMEENGYSRIGDIIGQHIWLDSMETDEAMIVNYADKRVMHDQVVSLDMRFLDLMERYGRNDQSRERMMKHYAHVCEIEQRLVDLSGIDPGWLQYLNLIPGDHPLNGGDRLLGKNRTVEEQHHDIDLERID
ncbi:hypothetical protein EG833_03965 [archaeon]|nr:hypothetical protein [archaeon]